MKIRSFIIFIFLIMPVSINFAQTERETRAVWVATNFRLDWPPQTLNQEKQKQELIAIFDNIKSKNLNTVYFQVRSNGTVLFKSSYDPFSSYITGEINGNASYDPLQLAVEEAHKHGLEIHAWVNVVRCFNGSETKVLNNPNHISKRKPEWIIEDIRDGQRSLWLDPGLPEVREYISEMIVEMVKNYDVDGVHLDYIRYPGRNFDDEFSYSVHGAGLSRDEYRRKNIIDLVALINKKIKSVKYYVKLGAAPIGIYKNLKGVNGWEGYTEVYQDSREWLRLGIVDYIAPQIYWGINDTPRFAPIAKDWSDNSFGRSVVLGIGAYKQNVKPEIDQMVQYSRSVDADGVSFFRYENIKDLEFTSFRNKTYPAAMAWLDGIYPDPPADLVLLKKPGGGNKFSLNWNSKKIRSGSDSLSYFALYNLPGRNSELLPDYLYDILPAEKSSADISIDKPRRVNYFFTLKSVSKLWNESIESSNVAGTKIEEMESLAEIDDFFTRPALMRGSGGSSKILIYAKAKEKVEISITDGKRTEMLLSENILPGKNIFTISPKISDYNRMKIQFKSSLKEFDLKF